MPAPDALIDVIIPNWNGRSMLRHCLDSLRRQTFRRFRVTVVDNGSSDNSAEMVAELFPEVGLIRFTDNTGFAHAVNEGILHAKCPWVLLLNNDMEVPPDCLEELLHGIARYPDYPSFALKMISFHQRQLTDGAGNGYIRAGVGYRLGTMESSSAYTQNQECFGACGGAALYRRSVFDQIGLFDQDFFAYLEDVDLNLRMQRHGLRCMYLAKAVVYHIGSASSGSRKINPVTVRLSTRNNFRVIEKNYSLRLFLRFLPVILVYQFFWFLYCVSKGMLISYLQGLQQALAYSRHHSRGNAQQSRQNSLINSVAPVSEAEFATEIIKAEKAVFASIIARRQSSDAVNRLLRLYVRFFL